MFREASIARSTGMREFSTDLCYASALNTKTILIDSDGMTVEQQRPRVRLDCPQINGHDER